MRAGRRGGGGRARGRRRGRRRGGRGRRASRGPPCPPAAAGGRKCTCLNGARRRRRRGSIAPSKRHRPRPLARIRNRLRLRPGSTCPTAAALLPPHPTTPPPPPPHPPSLPPSLPSPALRLSDAPGEAGRPGSRRRRRRGARRDAGSRRRRRDARSKIFVCGAEGSCHAPSRPPPPPRAGSSLLRAACKGPPITAPRIRPGPASRVRPGPASRVRPGPAPWIITSGSLSESRASQPHPRPLPAESLRIAMSALTRGISAPSSGPLPGHKPAARATIRVGSRAATAASTGGGPSARGVLSGSAAAGGACARPRPPAISVGAAAIRVGTIRASCLFGPRPAALARRRKRPARRSPRARRESVSLEMIQILPAYSCQLLLEGRRRSCPSSQAAPCYFRRLHTACRNQPPPRVDVPQGGGGPGAPQLASLSRSES